MRLRRKTPIHLQKNIKKHKLNNFRRGCLCLDEYWLNPGFRPGCCASFMIGGKTDTHTYAKVPEEVSSVDEGGVGPPQRTGRMGTAPGGGRGVDGGGMAMGVGGQGGCWGRETLETEVGNNGGSGSVGKEGTCTDEQGQKSG